VFQREKYLLAVTQGRITNKNKPLTCVHSVVHRCEVLVDYKSILWHIKKVKQSHYRPGQAQRVLRKLRFPDFVSTAQDGGKVVSLTHRPPLPPGNTPGTHFC